MSKRKSLINVAMAGIAAFLLLAATPALAEDVTVKIANFTFGPQELKVKAGTTVTWTNEDDIPHTVVSPNNFRSKALDTDATYSFTFTTPGTYKYFCSLHPHMTGTVVVETATGALRRHDTSNRRKSLVDEIWRLMQFDLYRPELHYMRGPGPKWHAKHYHRRHHALPADCSRIPSNLADALKLTDDRALSKAVLEAVDVSAVSQLALRERFSRATTDCGSSRCATASCRDQAQSRRNASGG